MSGDDDDNVQAYVASLGTSSEKKLLQRRLLERRSYKVPLLPYEDRSEEFKAIGSAFKQNFALQRHLAISFILTFMAPRAFSVGR